MGAPAGGDVRFGRNASLLWLAQFVSATGDAVFMPCLAWIAGRTGSSEAGVGTAVFLATIPYLVFGPLAGAWVDRANRRAVMVVSDLLRAALLLALPAVAAATGGMTFGLIVGTGILLATFSTPFLPARDALLPALIGGRSLSRWNAVMQTSGQLAMVVGLCLGGLLMAGADPSADELRRVEQVLQLDGATFLVSALLLLAMRVPGSERPAAPRRHLLRDAGDGLVYAARDPVVGGLLLLTALNNLAIMGPAIVGAALLVQDVFALGPAHYAWFEGCMGAGMVAGSAVIAIRGRRWRMGTVVLWGMVLDGLTYLPFVWIADYRLALAAIVLHGVFIPFIVVGRTSLIQQHVPRERLGKVFALVNITVIGMTAISAALSGWIAQACGPQVLFGLAGGFGALSGVVGLFVLRKRLATVGERA
jgi:DHA3 family macrolide efflux protein-like MFS transporter